MMEIACFTVEMAAKSGGVFPEVLFSVAKHWFDLYMRVSVFLYLMFIQLKSNISKKNLCRIPIQTRIIICYK